MFSRALKAAEKFTCPVITSKRLANGNIRSGLASFIVVNPEGWIVSAAHVFQDLGLIAEHGRQMEARAKETEAIGRDISLTEKQKRKQIGRLPKNPEWITHQAVLWGVPGCLPGAQISRVSLNPLADIGVGKLELLDPTWVTAYPVFGDPAAEMPAGTSLCRLGFPFHRIEATFDEPSGKFTLAKEVLPVPRFPNDGILTRHLIYRSSDGGQQAQFIETSTPGLRGQSGGPIFDVDGRVWGVQTHTNSLPLGFAPTVRQGNREITEHQFMHVGVGAHVKEVLQMFRDFGIRFNLSSSEREF